MDRRLAGLVTLLCSLVACAPPPLLPPIGARDGGDARVDATSQANTCLLPSGNTCLVGTVCPLGDSCRNTCQCDTVAGFARCTNNTCDAGSQLVGVPCPDLPCEGRQVCVRPCCPTPGCTPPTAFCINPPDQCFLPDGGGSATCDCLPVVCPGRNRCESVLSGVLTCSCLGATVPDGGRD